MSWERLVRKIVKGEPISYRNIEPCESKFLLLPINRHKCMNFSDEDRASNLGKLNKDDEKFLKNYVEKKKWVFKNKGKSREFDVDNISEDEKEIKKQEKYEAGFNSIHDYDPYYNYNNADKKNRTEGELKKVKSEISWQRLVRKIKKGEPISYSDIEPCESKFLLLPINSHKYMIFSGIHDDYDGETEMRKLNNDETKFLKNYVEKKNWVFKNKGKSREFDDLDNISEDEKEIAKQEKFEAEFNSPYDLHEYDLQKPEDMYPYHKYNGSTSLEPVA
ncbi:hypothetical protein MKW98_000565 [Papaver atlanticum]|uniref:Uncharacterized protein n=1 Tax=Papaver atlanticum TaxID=357466 RepID=A0AAD4S4A2_9MAGN|nr:hypothetical protein MKW98_000565 [Papaver atlanticum]